MLNKLVKIKGGFVRAVKITDDFFSEELNKHKLESYYVNPIARDAFFSISNGLHPTSKNRVHLISGTYGSGKSHFGLVMANYLSKNSGSEAFEMIFRRLKEKDPDKAIEIYTIRYTDKPYLIILIEGYDPDGAEHALLKGLKDALTDSKRGNLPEKILKTSYRSALTKIDDWGKEKQHFIDEMEEVLESKGQDIDTLKNKLKEFNEDAYRSFKELHKQITRHDFIPEYNVKAPQLYLEISEVLIREHQHKGIAIIWDQFNEHLESTRPGDLGKEVSFLRDFTEKVERSGENQIHLILISHNPPHTYVQGRISKEALDNWKTFEGRIFRELTLTAVDEAEELIGYAITKSRETEEWRRVEQQIDRDTTTVDEIVELGLFPGKDRNWVVETVFKGGFPLHPIAVYCLPRISDVVGQAERTMFTFFEEKIKEGGLTRFINETPILIPEDKLGFYTADRLFDFFKDAIENTPETRHIIKNYSEALGKVKDKQEILTQRIMKALVIIHAIKTKHPIPLLATPRNLSLLLNAKEQRIKSLLDSLKASEVFWVKEATGEYDFRAGELISNFKDDFEKAKNDIVWDNPILVLRSDYPPENIAAREYESEYRVKRWLSAHYISVDELNNINLYKNQITNEYKDGIVLYVIAESNEEIEEAKKKAVSVNNPQIVIAIPKHPLKIYDTLKDLKALERLKINPVYTSESTQGYLEWEDRHDKEKQELDSEINSLKTITNLYWFSDGEGLEPSGKKDTNIADYVMKKVFNKTPIVEHEKMASRWTQDQRSDRIKLNSQILDVKKDKIDYVWKGKAPAEKTILEQTFNPQKMLKIERKGNSDYYDIIEPRTEPMKEIWDIMKKHMIKAGPNVEFWKLVKELQLPPYGLSPRVLELFLSAFFRLHPNRFTIKTKRTKYSSFESREFIGETIHEIINDPDPEKVLIEYREKFPLEEDYLLTINDIVSPKKDWGKLPIIEGVGSLFIEWFENIPTVTKFAADLSKTCKRFLEMIGKVKKDVDLRELMFKEIPTSLDIGEEIANWDKEDLEHFESALKQVVDELNQYPDKIVKKAVSCFAEVFGVKRDTKFDVMEKIKNWYGELDASAKQAPLTGDAFKLRKYADIEQTDQFEQKFLIELPKELGIKGYTKWENVNESLEDYKKKLLKAKTEIEKYHKQVVTKPAKAKKLSKEAESLRLFFKEKIRKAGITKEEIIILLEELLEEYKK
jgi:ElaB/YqjD/DUF883 family membrane-anchored ribosome-binding protein